MHFIAVGTVVLFIDTTECGNEIPTTGSIVLMISLAMISDRRGWARTSSVKPSRTFEGK
jgi:hypothetical protein